MSKISSGKIFLVTLAILFLMANFFFIPSVNAATSSELEDQIKDQQNKLNQTVEEINSLQARLDDNKKTADSLDDGLPKLEAEIKQIETELELNKTKLKLISEQNELNKKNREKLEITQKQTTRKSYIAWRVNQNNVLDFEKRNDFFKMENYGATVAGIQLLDIKSLRKEIDRVESEINDYDGKVAELEEMNKALGKKKQEIVDQINYYNSLIASNQNDLSNLQGQQISIEGYINTLLAEQKEAAQKESEILNGSTPLPPPIVIPETPPPSGGGSTPPATGGIYITGIGRDLYQGHGVGMSQWGAYGAGLNGWSFEQILTFYYSNTRIEARPGNITVTGVGTMDSNTYAAGLGEVPNKACGNASQVSARPDKYVLDNPNTAWDCWPEETIKAQVVAARSYAMVNSPICTTAACQVYAGGTGKKWAADETKDLVIVSNGSTHTNGIINALYSSDNSQGSGTANNDTIFQNFSGDGTPYSYLRAVNDSSFATPTSWTNWYYQTTDYTLNSIFQMIYFTAFDARSSASQTNKNYAANMIVGSSSFTNVSLERDSSGRVKKVWLTDQNGTKKVIGGWWFKNLWNTWTYDIGKGDYIYSQTFYINFK